QEAELVFVRPRQLRFGLGRKLPELLLERTQRLFPGLVEELLVRVARLSLILRILTKPVVDLFAQRIGDVVVQHRLKIRGQMDLRRLGAWEVVESSVGKSRCAVLNRAGQAILLARNL